MPTEKCKCYTCGWLYRKDPPCEHCGPDDPRWKLREGVVKSCDNCLYRWTETSEDWCPRCNTHGYFRWEPQGKYPVELELENIARDKARRAWANKTLRGWRPRKPGSALTLQCLGGPKNGEFVAFRGMVYHCPVLPEASAVRYTTPTEVVTTLVVTHEYIPQEVACGGRHTTFLVYNGEVGAGNPPAQRKEPEMKTTRTAYVLVQREKRDADGKAIRGEKILRPEKAEDGYAYIDLTCLEKGTRREAVLEQEQKFIIEAGLKFADVEVVFPFPQT